MNVLPNRKVYETLLWKDKKITCDVLVPITLQDMGRGEFIIDIQSILETFPTIWFHPYSLISLRVGTLEGYERFTRSPPQ